MAARWWVDGLTMENYARALMGEIAPLMSVEDGKVSILMGQYEFLSDSLFGLLEHGYAIDHTTLFHAFEDALRECFKVDQKLSAPKKLAAEFDKKCGKLLSKQSEFILITSINLKVGVFQARSIRGCALKFYRNLPRKYVKGRNTLLAIKNSINVNVENDGYLFVEVKTRNINDRTAFEFATEALAIYRAIYQLFFSNPIQMFAGPEMSHKYPSDLALKLGNIHTMHLESGESAADAHWFEDHPNFSEPINVSDIAGLDKNVAKMLRKLTNWSQEYRGFCERILLAFADAMDTRDPEAHFVKLWLCLELLTGADDAKTIIKRVSFFYAQQDIAAAQLRALRAARNSHVHAGATPGRMDLKNFRLGVFVEHLFVFALANHFKFSRISQWHDFMSTTTDGKSIAEQIARLKMVRKFASPAEINVS